MVTIAVKDIISEHPDFAAVKNEEAFQFLSPSATRRLEKSRLFHDFLSAGDLLFLLNDVTALAKC